MNFGPKNFGWLLLLLGGFIPFLLSDGLDTPPTLQRKLHYPFAFLKMVPSFVHE